MTTLVSRLIAQCINTILVIAFDKRLQPQFRQELEDCLARLKIWAADIYTWPLSSRFYNDSDIRVVLISMLERLVADVDGIRLAVANTLHPTLTEEGEEEGEESDKTSPETDVYLEFEREESALSSDVESSCSSPHVYSDDSEDSDASEDEAEVTGLGGQVMSALRRANGVLDDIYHLSSLLRKTVSLAEISRVREYMKREMAEDERDEIEELEDQVRTHLLMHSQTTSSVLINRLVAAAKFRRMKYWYRKSHHRSQQDINEAFAKPAVLAQTQTVIDSGYGSSGTSKAERSTFSQASHVRRSDTDASPVNTGNPKQQYPYSPSVAASQITISAFGRRERLEVPPAPKGLVRGATCRFCFRSITKKDTEPERWKRHVIKDMEPYVCLFEDCHQGDMLFTSSDEWLQHMRWSHTVLWQCLVPGHENEAYISPDELRKHIRSEHEDISSEEELSVLVENGELPAADPFSLLPHSISSGGDALGRNAIHRCPLCSKFGASSDPDKQETIQDHILGHLEEIALFSLPVEEEGQSDTSSISDTIWVSDLGVKLFERVVKNSNAEIPVAIPPSARSSLMIRLSSLRCPIPNVKQQFFPWGSVDRLITPQEVIQALRGSSAALSEERLDLYASKICPQKRVGGQNDSQHGYRKTFAILIMMRRAPDIVRFVDEGIDDSHLPLEFIVTEHDDFEMRVRGSKDQKLEFLSDWENDLLHHDFERNQWMMLAPYFAKMQGRPARIYELPEKVILPWLSEDREYHGGYSWVSKVEIHPHHHNFDKLKDHMVFNNLFAIKHLKAQNSSDEINSNMDSSIDVAKAPGNLNAPEIMLPTASTEAEKDIKAEFEHEIDILNRLSCKTHPHLITLLAAYQLGDERCMIFPWAECDLKSMWQNHSQSGTPLMKSNLEWVLSQCLGLAEGLKRIHQSKSTPTADEQKLGRVFGAHGDIKPENILFFKDQRKPGDRGRLVITDFGLTRFHSNDTKTHLRNTKPPATPTYRPPECDIHSSPISQSFDIWSFGCVLLEFVAWYLGNWTLVDAFVKKRKLLNPLMNNWHTDQFFEIMRENHRNGPTGNKVVVARVKQEIYEFVNELHSHPSCSDIIHDVLEFIMQEMVTVHTRAPCEKVVGKLQELSARLSGLPDLLKATPWPRQQVKPPMSVAREMKDYPVGTRYKDLPVNPGMTLRPGASGLQPVQSPTWSLNR